MICFLLGSLSGCASSPVDLPTCEVEPSTTEIQTPLRLPEMPSPERGAEGTFIFTGEQFAVLLDYATISGGNYDIASENAAALEKQSEAYNELSACAASAHQFGQVREEQLARERRDHFIDNWFHRGLIALGILVAL